MNKLEQLRTLYRFLTENQRALTINAHLPMAMDTVRMLAETIVAKQIIESEVSAEYAELERC